MSKQHSNWHRNSVIYQIYPRSFKDGNDDGIGDLKGIVQNLDYLNDGTDTSLGVDAIWLSPIYKSPMVDFGYDVQDYKQIDPIFGTFEDFDLLISEAHKRNIKVIMDFIPNHTSDLHPWFLESRGSRNSSKRNWYVWKDGKPDGSPPNNWLSRFGGSAWEYDKETKQFYLHSFDVKQPDLNWHNEEVRKEMLDVMRFWLGKGVDGFRVDALEFILEDENFEDEPLNPEYVDGKDDPYFQLQHIYSVNQPKINEMVGIFSEVLDEYDNKFMVNEVNIPIDKMADFYNSNNGTCIPFNFHLMFMKWDANKYREFIDQFESFLDEKQHPTYVLGNHDFSRLASRLDKKKARVAAMLLLTLRGSPYIYYGDEIGMENGFIPPDRVKDPWEKRAPGKNLGRDPVRTPMQWTTGKNAGFSQNEPWLPVGNTATSVESERKDSDSLFNLYRRLIHYRKKSRALIDGEYRSIETHNDGVYGFIRKHENEKILVVLNFSDKEQQLSLGVGKADIICSTDLSDTAKSSLDLSSVNLKPSEGYVISLNK